MFIKISNVDIIRLHFVNYLLIGVRQWITHQCLGKLSLKGKFPPSVSNWVGSDVPRTGAGEAWRSTWGCSGTRSSSRNTEISSALCHSNCWQTKWWRYESCSWHTARLHPHCWYCQSLKDIHAHINCQTPKVNPLWKIHY